MYAALSQAGVPASFIRIAGAGHRFDGADFTRANAAMVQWFEQYLRGARNRPVHLLVLFALITAVSASSATRLVAQEAARNIPEPALRELLGHVVRSETEPGQRIAFAFLTERFRENARAAEVARSAGFALYESWEQILRCSNDAPPTCRFATGDRVVDIRSAHAHGDALTVHVVVSTFVRRMSEEGRLFGVMREITLSRTDGRWQVQGDRVLFRS